MSRRQTWGESFGRVFVRNPFGMFYAGVILIAIAITLLLPVVQAIRAWL